MDYNTDKLGPEALPTSVIDLGSSEWKGKDRDRVALTPTSSRWSPRSCRTHGEDRTLEWLEAIKANAGSHAYSDNRVLADAINRGQVELGLVNAAHRLPRAAKWARRT